MLNKAHSKIDVALISQGVMHYRRTTVVDPVTGRANEANFTTSALTPNLLICGIQPLLAHGRDVGRVVHVSSDAHRSLATVFDGNNISPCWACCAPG